MTYTPAVDDYVKWKHNGHCDEGWVYFVCPDYITIEVLVKCNTDEHSKDSPLHQTIHELVECYAFQWHELEYIARRDGQKELLYGDGGQKQ